MTRLVLKIAGSAVLGLLGLACSGGKAPDEAAASAALAAPAAQPAPPGKAHDHDHDQMAKAAHASTMPPVPEGAKVAFKNLQEGATVKGPLVDGKVKVKVEMGAEGIAVKPAGPIEEGSGHHHLILGGGAMPIGTVVPADATHIHYGQAQTEAEVALAPGAQTLTLQFADGIHRSYGPELSATIMITVEAEAPAQ